MRPAEQDRADIARKRIRWKAHQARIDASRLVFIDETWIKTNMAPLRGWGPSGQRLEASAPFGHWKTMTFIAALRYDRISAPWVIDGPINGELFTLYVEKVLAPTLAKGEVVILDNLGSHKGKPARNAIRARGAHLLFSSGNTAKRRGGMAGLATTGRPKARVKAAASWGPVAGTSQHTSTLWFRAEAGTSRAAWAAYRARSGV
jgi:transposase